jgi:hypothetical protein
LNQGQHTRRVFPVTDNKAIPNVVSERAHWYLFASTKLQEVFTFIFFHNDEGTSYHSWVTENVFSVSILEDSFF